MSVQAIGALEAIQPQTLQTTQAGTTAVAPGFASWVEHELNSLNTQLVSAEKGISQLASGTAENLHAVMLQLEQARLAMQIAGQVRSRVLEAYQDVMRMQV
ncbi:flagellar hook-basal body complex protein FliE [Pelomonas saccharophila]|uniref:Flagellar hook-basal body complex protein FliE n=1 Tax=Roseateles saccharophilus TaxID=304 RepID=A0ABU1YH91_ROSSA|nr:flagellar hook-basal body complex protein FliE [Roseateles saccharophilus]MDR7268218.1 flagellar hook-basal body complex protein FliE [Roseateles saccharophilus]